MVVRVVGLRQSPARRVAVLSMVCSPLFAMFACGCRGEGVMCRPTPHAGPSQRQSREAWLCGGVAGRCCGRGRGPPTTSEQVSASASQSPMTSQSTHQLEPERLSSVSWQFVQAAVHTMPLKLCQSHGAANDMIMIIDVSINKPRGQCQ